MRRGGFSVARRGEVNRVCPVLIGVIVLASLAAGGNLMAPLGRVNWCAATFITAASLTLQLNDGEEIPVSGTITFARAQMRSTSK